MWCKRSKASTGKRLKSCGLCRAAYYCSPEHQELDWETHKLTCTGFSASGEHTRMPKPEQRLNPSHELIKRHLVEVMRCGKAGDRWGEGAAYCKLGIAYHSLGQFTRAVDYHNKHLAIALEVGDRA